MWKARIEGGPCKGCTCVARPDAVTPFLGPPLDFVYLYIDSAAKGDELRFSIRSVFKNYLGPARVWIVGDRPDWYTGLHVDVPRIGETPGRSRLDRAFKFHHVATKVPEINERFVAMQDDIYFVNPVTYYDINRRWINGKPLTPEKVHFWNPTHGYQIQKKRTALKLFANGVKFVSDYSTHTPKFYFKEDLERLIEQYDALTDPLVCTILFDNAIEREDRPFPIQPYRLRLKTTDHKASEVVRSCASKVFMNHLDKSWTEETRNALSFMFPEKSVVER